MNGDGGSNGDHVLVGMQEGQIYLVQITRYNKLSFPISNIAPVVERINLSWNYAPFFRSSSTIMKWVIENEKHKSEVTCITTFDLMKTGIPDIIIGRQDGNVEVYTTMQTDEVNEFKPPIEKYSYVSWRQL